MLTSYRARQIIALVAGHLRDDPATKWTVRFWKLPDDWSIWIIVGGRLHEYDHLWPLHT
jgi:hypothetical protein